MSSKGKSGNTNGGTETSFTKTPQAKDDLLGTPQSGRLDYINSLYMLDVTSNDLGGNAKSLWSVDDGINDSGAMSGYVAGDLLTQDSPGATGIASNRSTFGAALHITTDGRIAYDTSTIDADHAASLTGLALGETLTDSFIYAIRLANGTLSWAQASVVLTGVNDQPVVQDVTLAAIEDGGAVTRAFDGDDVDSDDDGSSLVYTIVGSPDTGTLVNNGNGTFTYNPGSSFQSLAVGEVATLTLSYTATDKHGSVSAPKNLVITVTGVNDAPTLAAGALGATEDGSVASLGLAVLGEDVDSDNDGSTLTYTLLNAAAGGSASINGTTLDFDPDADFQSLAAGETTSFDLQVRATDAHGATADNTVEVTVTGVNDMAVVQDVALAAVEDGAAVTGYFNGDDVDSDDDGSTLAYTIVGSSAGGALTNNGNGTFTFDPGMDFQSLAAGEVAEVNLSYTATDQHGAASAPADLVITITGTNDAPTLAGDALNATEDGSAVSLDLATLGADIDSDDDGATLSYSLLNGPAGGSASISGTTLSFSPDAEFQSLAAGQTTSFNLQVRATDVHGASADNTIAVTVTGTNDAPEIQAGSGGTGSVSGQVAVVPFTVQQYLGYRSTSLSDLQNYAANNAASYTVTSNVIDYTDDPGGFAGEIPGSSPWPAAAANVVTGTAHAMNDNFFVRITGEINVTAADTYTFRTFNDDGVFLRVNNTLIINDTGIHPEAVHTGSIALTPGIHPIELYFFEFGGEASLEFSYRNTSGGFELVDPNPMLRDSGALTFSDVDLTDTHSVSVSSSSVMLGALTATVASDTTGTGTDGQILWDYAVDNNAVRYLGEGETKVETFTVSVSDGNGGVAQQQVDVTIAGINDVAELGNAVVDLTETDSELFASGVLSIADVDEGEASFNAQTDTAGVYGAFSIDANGSWSFASNGALNTLTEGQLVTDVFTVTSLDGTASTVTINITGTADGPTGVDDSNSLTASTVVADNSNVVYWADWHSVELLGGSVNEDKYVRVNGTITLGDGYTIDVSYEGLAWIVQLGQNDPAPGMLNYTSLTSEWIEPNAANKPYTSSQVSQGPQAWDIIGLNEAFSGGGYQNGSGTRVDFSPRNLTFSEPVEDLLFAVMSMNVNGYKFDQNFQIISQGQGKYGAASPISPTSFGDGQYGIVSTGEFHGVLKIDGSVEQMTWTSQNKEAWNGFTVGTYGQAQTATASGNVLANDDEGNVSATIEVSAVDGSTMVGNSVTLTLASGATLKVNRDGEYFYDDRGEFAALGADGSYTENVAYTVRDEQGNTDTATLSITVNGVNDAAVLGNAVVDLTETDDPLSASGVLSISDIDTGEALYNVQSNTSGAYGTFSIGSNGAWVYNTNGALDFLLTGQVVSDVFNVTSVDGTATTVTVNINGTSSTIASQGSIVQNGSFENDLTDWATIAGGVDRVAGSHWQAADGDWSLDLNAFSRGGVQQTVATESGNNYLVSFQMSKNNDGAGTIPSAAMRVSAGSDSQDYTFAESNSPTDMSWRNGTFEFTADSTSSLLSFESLTLGPPAAKGPALDNVAVVAHTVITGFSKEDGDVLDLSNLLTALDMPRDIQALYGYLQFWSTSEGTEVRINVDGAGDDFFTAITLIGVPYLNPAADYANYTL